MIETLFSQELQNVGFRNSTFYVCAIAELWCCFNQTICRSGMPLPTESSSSCVCQNWVKPWPQLLSMNLNLAQLHQAMFIFGTRYAKMKLAT